MLFVYLIGLVKNLIPISVLIVSISIVFLIINFSSLAVEGEEILPKRLKIFFITSLFVFTSLIVFTPSKETAILLAGIYAGNDFLKQEEVSAKLKAVNEIIDMKLQKILKETKEKMIKE